MGTSSSQSMKCVVLAEAGAQRSRFLATLYKDERSQKVEPGVLFIMIEYMYLDRMISSNLKKEFAEQLSPHHLSRLADGSTLLDRAVVEHNIVSCSKVYRNVYVNQLAIILDVPEQSVELTVGKMVAEGILAASIDQICGLVYFHDGRLATDSESKIPSGIDQADPVAILANQWETQVKMVGGQVEDIFCLLRTKYPQWFLSRNSL